MSLYYHKMRGQIKDETKNNITHSDLYIFENEKQY